MQNDYSAPYISGGNMIENEKNKQSIKNLIYEIRGQKVMLDSDLANLYGVETKRLNENMRRNYKRFPPEFTFQLTDEEWKNLRSQIATFSNIRKYKPYVFTEHGILLKNQNKQKG